MARDGEKGEQLIFSHWLLVFGRWRLAETIAFSDRRYGCFGIDRWFRLIILDSVEREE